MLLAIDVGNTQTVIGLYADEAEGPGRSPSDGLVDHWRISTSLERTSDELALLFQEFIGFHGADFDEDIGGIVISSGVPRVSAALRQMTDRYFGFDPVVLGPGVRTGMPIGYDDPTAVGPDRIADAVAAFHLHGGPAIVVDFGTATVLDAISADGEYLGGAIVPGVEISLEALYARSSLLRRVELVEPASPVGRNTVASIQSGVLYGFAGLVDALVDRFRTELGDATVIGTGGLVSVMGPYTRTIEHAEPWLTLHGLRLIWDKNRP